MAVNMELNRKIIGLYNNLYTEGRVRSKKEFCSLIDYEEPSFSHVLSGKRSFPKRKIPLIITQFNLTHDYFDINTYAGEQDVCDKIMHVRKLKKITQKEFAKQLNVTQSAISAIENKTNSQPGYDIIWGLINKIGVNPYFIFSNDQTVFDTVEKYNNRTKIDQTISHLKEALANINAIKL